MDFQSQQISVEVIPPVELRPADIQAWAALQGRTTDFANPLFSPYFSIAVGQVRSDVRIAIYRRAGQAVGFLPFHKRPGGLARPIGAPFSDYHGIVADRDIGIRGREALAMAGIRAFRANGLVDPYGLFDDVVREVADAYVLTVDGDAEAYMEALRAGNPKRFKNFRRLESKLEREVGPLRFVHADIDRASFDAILDWKREQFRRTGLQDVLRPDWVRDLMDNLFELRDGPMTGKLAALYAGDVLVAGQFGVRQGAVFHPWIASANPDYTEYSSGQMFLLQAIRYMASDRVQSYDLSIGHDHYKKPFGPQIRKVGVGSLAVEPGRIPRAERPGAVGKVWRRLDHIAAAEPGIAGRMRGLAEAAMATTRRGLGNDSANEGVS